MGEGGVVPHQDGLLARLLVLEVLIAMGLVEVGIVNSKLLDVAADLEEEVYDLALLPDVLRSILKVLDLLLLEQALQCQAQLCGHLLPAQRA